MNTPCNNCPFRTDKHFRLRRERKEDIVQALHSGGSFHCHKTVDYSGDSDGEVTSNSQFCAGALIMMEKEGGAHMNQMVRLYSRLGFIDLDKLDTDAPVYDSAESFIEAEE